MKHLMWFLGCALLLAVPSCEEKKEGSVKKGTLLESVANKDAFYTIRGGEDYSRAPLVYPLHLVNIVGHHDLVWEQEPLLDNVRRVGMSGDTVYGRSEASQIASGDSVVPGAWFIATAGKRGIRKFGQEREWQATLQNMGVSDLTLIDSDRVVDDFMSRGILAFGRPPESGAAPETSRHEEKGGQEPH